MSEIDPFGDSPNTAAQDSTMNDATDFFSGGPPSCKFKTIGDKHVGVIMALKKEAAIDFDDGTPKKFKSGDPVMQLVVTLQTEERDPEVDDDDGLRRLYLEQSSGKYKAVEKAIRESKGRFCVGGKLAIKYTSDLPKTNPKHNAPKEFTAVYAPPGQAFNAAPSTPVTPPSNLNDGVKRQARIEAMTKFKAVAGPALPKETLLKAWAVAVEGYFGVGTNEADIKPAQWQNFILNDFAPAKSTVSQTEEFEGSDIPF